MLRGPRQPPGSAGGSGSGSDHGGPLLRGRAREPPPGWAMRPGPALPRTGCRFCWCPCSRSRPVRGMMATGASERTHHDVAQEGSCADDQDPEWRCLGHRRCGGGRMSPARGELPYVDEHAITIAAPRSRVWSALQRYTATFLRIPERSPIARLLGTQPRAGFEVLDSAPAHSLTLAGRHRFARYRLTFDLTDAAEGATRLRTQRTGQSILLPGSVAEGLAAYEQHLGLGACDCPR